MLSGSLYLTGAQIFGRLDRLQYNLAITNGSPSNPADNNNSNGFNLLARLTYNPIMGLVFGTSISRGTYLDQSVKAMLRPIGRKNSDFHQTIGGLDAHYSIGHLILYSELIFNRWDSPFIDSGLDATALYFEAKYTLAPRLYVAGRISRIRFSDIADVADIDADGRFNEPWDYPLNQQEVGVGYHVNRNTRLKAMLQFNHTEQVPGGDPADDLFALQAVIFF